MMKKRLLIASIFALSLSAAGQSRWYAPIDTVAEAGYYNIRLSAEWAGLSKQDNFEDLRILDENGEEVPYLVRETPPISEVNRLEMFPLLENSARDSVNVLIVDNSVRERIDRFHIVLRAAEVPFYASVRGGDGNGGWYTVKQRTRLHGQPMAEGNEIAVLDIPGGDYPRYEITVTNSHGSPLSISGVGRMERQSTLGRYDPIDPGQISVRIDSLRRTLVSFPDLRWHYRIDRIEVYASCEALFRRKARLETGPRNLALVLSSKGENATSADRFPVDSTSVLSIINGDNPPLGIDSVRLWSLPRYLCARLEAGRRYTLTAGAEGRSRYDLEYFRDELVGRMQLPVVDVALPARKELPPPPTPQTRFFEKPGFLWAVMALAGLILLGACLQALRTVRNYNKK